MKLATSWHPPHLFGLPPSQLGVAKGRVATWDQPVCLGRSGEQVTPSKENVIVSLDRLASSLLQAQNRLSRKIFPT